MHRLIATFLVAVVGTAAAGTPLHAQETGAVRGTVTLEDGDFVSGAVIRAAHTVSLTASNVTNVLYRNHTSFIKDRVHEMGRGVRVHYAVRFH